MPTYEFRCANGHEFEEFHRRISDAPTTATCPVCGEPAERRISGGAGLLFKGSGFYLTDYGKNAHRGDTAAKTGGDAAKSESGAKSEGGAKTDGGAAKPAGGAGASSGTASGGSTGGGSSSGGSAGGSSGAKSE
jgi:putative FmdB family regulatory protein